MATMTEVADAAGCSTTTVSHVLNGTRAVAPDTRRRVERALRELGYRRRVTRPGHAPRNLAAVGMTMAASNSYFTDLVAGVEQELARAGRVLVLADSHDDPETERRAVASLLSHRIEAMVLAPTAGWAERTKPLLVERGVPFVLVDRLVQGGDVDQIAVENEPGSRALVEHLLSVGHRRVGMIAGLPGLSTTIERELGFRRAHAKRGVPVEPSLIECGESSVEGGRRAMMRLLDRIEPPTAIFTGNNAMTVGALTALRQRRVSVPDDIAVVAFDDFEWSPLVNPGLTTAAQPCHALGARAVQLLMSRLANPNQPRRTVRVPVSIEHRESCGCGRSRAEVDTRGAGRWPHQGAAARVAGFARTAELAQAVG